MEKTAVAENPFKVGDVLSSSWGYSMTIVNYYQVVATTPKMVTVREIQSKIVSGDGMRGESLALPNSFMPKRYWQESTDIKRRVISGGIKINDSERAYMWDGEPKYHDHWD